MIPEFFVQQTSNPAGFALDKKNPASEAGL